MKFSPGLFLHPVRSSSTPLVVFSSLVRMDPARSSPSSQPETLSDFFFFFFSGWQGRWVFPSPPPLVSHFFFPFLSWAMLFGHRFSFLPRRSEQSTGSPSRLFNLAFLFPFSQLRKGSDVHLPPPPPPPPDFARRIGFFPSLAIVCRSLLISVGLSTLPFFSPSEAKKSSPPSLIGIIYSPLPPPPPPLCSRRQLRSFPYDIPLLHCLNTSFWRFSSLR